MLTGPLRQKDAAATHAKKKGFTQSREDAKRHFTFRVFSSRLRGFA
jgi:hypothetical protein